MRFKAVTTCAALAAALLLPALAVAPEPARAATTADADTAMDAFVAAYWDPAKKYFYTNSDHQIHPEHAHGPEGGLYTDFWWEAQLWELVMDAYERTGEPGYRQMIDDVYDGFTAYYPSFANDYNDDIGWWALAGARAFEITGDTRYLTTSTALFDRLWAHEDATFGGGIWWKNTVHDQKNVATNAPAAMTAVRLYEATGTTAYLDKAKELFAWLADRLESGGHVYDHLEGPGSGTLVKWDFTYNFGTYIGAATELYEATGDAAYLARATGAGDWATTHLVNGGTINFEGIDDGGGFKSLLVRGLTRLATGHGRTEYLDFLQHNASQAWNQRRADGLVGPNWSAPAPSGNLQSLTAAAAVSALQVVPPDGGTGIEPDNGVYEAENGVTTELGAESTSPGFTGRGYLAGWSAANQQVTFHVNLAEAGAHELGLRYAAAAGEATRGLLINGELVATNHRFPGTAGWDAWATTVLDGIDLDAGHNTIVVLLDPARGNGNWLNFDRMTVTRTGLS
ncbi:glycoside hydrolase family 76 protein [Phytomonospora endophytica]|uniref:Putative alpha-1,6-mannanase (GH76 family) n=1 Tax=Phytomonospora endophytica TaxID=714109 RepID=A0A841FEK6_9ACTN|nr:glycoside hydrolase family 76 protein [Phytomonospora endophytica]MBB6033443.1 putative alpha-1,6-mannanase (GH76 family) [Phytomonospora endophytica]GIG65038.1 hypothetical protein Pen01_13330 [Phytomonospora endophytica]